MYSKNQLFGTIIVVAGLSSVITYLILRSKEAKSKAVQLPNKKTDTQIATEIVDKIKLLDGTVVFNANHEEDNVLKMKKRKELTDALLNLGYDLKFKSYQRTCNSEPCTTEYVLTSIKK